MIGSPFGPGVEVISVAKIPGQIQLTRIFMLVDQLRIYLIEWLTGLIVLLAWMRGE